MKQYKVGDEILYRLSADGENTWGQIKEIRYLNNPAGDEVRDYVVVPDGYIHGVTVRPTQVVDLGQVSADAAALSRIARQERARAGLLDELLGALSYYVECGAVLQFDHQIGELHPKTRVRKPLSEIVDLYTARRDDAARR